MVRGDAQCRFKLRRPLGVGGQRQVDDARLDARVGQASTAAATGGGLR